MSLIRHLEGTGNSVLTEFPHSRRDLSQHSFSCRRQHQLGRLQFAFDPDLRVRPSPVRSNMLCSRKSPPKSRIGDRQAYPTGFFRQDDCRVQKFCGHCVHHQSHLCASGKPVLVMETPSKYMDACRSTLLTQARHVPTERRCQGQKSVPPLPSRYFGLPPCAHGRAGLFTTKGKKTLRSRQWGDAFNCCAARLIARNASGERCAGILLISLVRDPQRRSAQTVRGTPIVSGAVTAGSGIAPERATCPVGELARG